MVGHMNSVQIESGAPHAARLASPRPGWLERYGAWVAGRPRAVLVVFALALALMGALGSGVFPRLSNGGYDVPGSESDRAATALAGQFGVREPAIVIALEVPAGIDSPAGVAAATAFVGQLAGVEGTSDVVSYWTSGRPPSLRGNDGRTGEIIIGSASAKLTDRADVGAAVQDRAARLDAADDSVRAWVGGTEAVNAGLGDSIRADLARAEAIAVPLQFILLLLVFGTLLSAGLPFVVALGSVVGSFFLVWLVSLTTDVSVFALNLITGLGLGLGIDYALLIVTRFREEMHGQDGRPGLEPREAVARTMGTAGRTVLFSGATVMMVVAAMTIFPQYFLRSFGYAGVAATFLAVISAMTALPAVLALAGRRIDRLRVLRRDLHPRDEGAWSRVARFVMRRPLPVTVVVLAVLGVLAAPVLGVTFAQPDQRILPADHPVAVASAVIADRFDGLDGSPVEVVLPGLADDAMAVTDYAARLSRLDHVASVTTPTSVLVDGRVVSPNPQPGSYRAGSDVRLRLVGDVNPRTSQGRDLVAAVRDLPAPTDRRLVGGSAARFTDSQQGIADRGRWALAWVAISTLVLLFLFTGSVLLPIKAVLLNVVSLLATLGVLVWIFQDGHLKWLVGDFTVTGSVDTSMAVLVAVVAFALSMDYEVFLLSRIAEEHRKGLDTRAAVVRGLQRSGRIITAAALLLAVVFATFVTSGVTSIKQLGLGVAFAILLDATVVRGLLVPALMRLLGRWNWWAPAPLARLHARIGLQED
jgi:putative drug exporter of the RND superfamily